LYQLILGGGIMTLSGGYWGIQGKNPWRRCPDKYPSWTPPACNFQALHLDPLLSIADIDLICVLDLTVQLLENIARKKSAS